MATPDNDAWDWPFLNYCATVLLHRTEMQFWRMTPRKLNALMAVYIELNSHNNGNGKAGFIDNVL